MASESQRRLAWVSHCTSVELYQLIAHTIDGEYISSKIDTWVSLLFAQIWAYAIAQMSSCSLCVTLTRSCCTRIVVSALWKIVVKVPLETANVDKGVRSTQVIEAKLVWMTLNWDDLVSIASQTSDWCILRVYTFSEYLLVWHISPSKHRSRTLIFLSEIMHDNLSFAASSQHNIRVALKLCYCFDWSFVHFS